MKRAAVVCLGLVVLLTIAASGCLFDPKAEAEIEGTLPPRPPAIPFPDSEDQVVANFKTVYTSMRIADYRAELHPQYVFILLPEDVLPGGSGRFTHAQELVAAENMFSGLPIERPGDTPVPAISGISFTILNRVSAWTDVGSGNPDFPNTRRGLYEIRLSFSRAGANTVIVYGQQEFYVSSQDSVVSGVTKQYYRLRGQRDLTIGSKTETTSWGGVKNLYR